MSKKFRTKGFLFLLALECGLFLIFFTIATASKINQPETALRTYLAAVAQRQLQQADQYLSKKMQAGAFSDELTWFVNAGDGDFPGQGEIQLAEGREQHKATDPEKAELILKLQDPERKPFDVRLLMQNMAGRWTILGPADYQTAGSYFGNGLALFNTGEPEQAMLEYHRGLLLDPANLRAHLELGQAIRESGRRAAARGAEGDSLKRAKEDALFEFSVALRLNPNSPLAHYYMGLAFHDDNQFDKAIEELREAVRLDPQDVFNHKLLAQFLRQRGGIVDLQEAVREFNLACYLNDQESCQIWNDLTQPRD